MNKDFVDIYLKILNEDKASNKTDKSGSIAYAALGADAEEFLTASSVTAISKKLDKYKNEVGNIQDFIEYMQNVCQEIEFKSDESAPPSGDAPGGEEGEEGAEGGEEGAEGGEEEGR